jgi:hypothetical protein
MTRPDLRTATLLLSLTPYLRSRLASKGPERPCPSHGGPGLIPTAPGKEQGKFLTLYNGSRSGIRAEIDGLPIYVPDGSCRRIGPLSSAGPLTVECFNFDRSTRLASRKFLLRAREEAGTEGYLIFNGPRDLRVVDLDACDTELGFPVPRGFDRAGLFRPPFEDLYVRTLDEDYDPRQDRIKSGP